ncbi:MAG: high-potential iron-sulfur protein [Steroidobacteraceae bacterium]|jgi:hypothetical protein
MRLGPTCRLSRRSLIQGGLAAALLPALRSSDAAAAPALTPLDPKEPAAASLGYTTDSATVDGKAIPNHAPDQKCANCVQFRGAASDAMGGCAIFPGRSVAANGWCKLWASTDSSMPE